MCVYVCNTDLAIDLSKQRSERESVRVCVCVVCVCVCNTDLAIDLPKQRREIHRIFNTISVPLAHCRRERLFEHCVCESVCVCVCVCACVCESVCVLLREGVYLCVVCACVCVCVVVRKCVCASVCRCIRCCMWAFRVYPQHTLVHTQHVHTRNVFKEVVMRYGSHLWVFGGNDKECSLNE